MLTVLLALAIILIIGNMYLYSMLIQLKYSHHSTPTPPTSAPPTSSPIPAPPNPAPIPAPPNPAPTPVPPTQNGQPVVVLPAWDMQTRQPTQVTQVGMLTEIVEDGSGSKPEHPVLPLYGKQVYQGSNKWYYYTSTDGYHMMHIPVVYKNKDCTNEYGCDEIFDGDEVFVESYDSYYRVKLYDRHLRYNPFV